MQKTNTMQRYPHPFLDKMMEIHKVDNDRDLAHHMEISIGSVSRIRGGTQPVSAQLILKVYDQTSLSIEDLRNLVKQYQKPPTPESPPCPTPIPSSTLSS